MDPPSSSSPRRDDAELQHELQQIASQMELENEADVDVQSAQDESDIDAESGDDDGSRVGRGAWVNGRWQDLLDPHPVPQRERRSMEALDPDYELEQRQVMNT